MARNSKTKAAPIIGEVYIAQIDGYIELKDEHSSNNPFKKSRVQYLRIINAICYTDATFMVLISIFNFSGDEYDDDYQAWKMNQSLLSVAPYTHYIWYLLLLVQGLFIAASFMCRLSELLGYTELAHTTEGWALQKLLPVIFYHCVLRLQ